MKIKDYFEIIDNDYKIEPYYRIKAMYNMDDGRMYTKEKIIDDYEWERTYKDDLFFYALMFANANIKENITANKEYSYLCDVLEKYDLLFDRKLYENQILWTFYIEYVNVYNHINDVNIPDLNDSRIFGSADNFYTETKKLYDEKIKLTKTDQ